MKSIFTGNIEKNSKTWLAFLLFILLAKAPFAQSTVTITDADLGSGTYNWTSDKTYLLDGFVYLESGGVLNITAGTVIKGLATPSTGDNASALIITVGAQINASGTAAHPIIFTSELDDVSDPSDLIASDRGLWGGLIILGDGILGNSSPTSNIEGIPTTEPRAEFGGSDNDNNAGTLKYVSIRHGGAELAPGDEINGLTLGGVGSGTTIEHVEVFSNLDDGIEFFGGAVNVKYATVAFCGDDGFDWDLGWVGNGQFWFVIQGADEADNGGEWDGAKPDGNAIFSNPTVFNATFIGSGTGSVTAKNTNTILMRDATAGTIANSIFTQYAHKALEIEDLPAASGVDSYTRLQNGELNLQNNIWFGFGNYTTLDAHPTTGIIRFTSGGDDTVCTDLINHLTTNENQITDPQLNDISRTPDGGLDPRPGIASPVTTSLSSYPADPFFTTVTYKGAFDVDGTPIWISGWTALEEYGYVAVTTGIREVETSDALTVSVYPNPARDVIHINYSIEKPGTIHLEIYDLAGHVVSRMAYEVQSNNNKITWDAKGLARGSYLLRASSSSSVHVTKLFIQ